MQDFQDKVAVITGAAAGIGKGIAKRCAHEGMKVVLSGINLENLLPLEAQLKAGGTDVISVQTDVSLREDIQNLADAALENFGAVHLLVNNAGVGAGPTIWESTWNDWEWVINVNLWGVICGLKIFIPHMLEQDTEGHIVNVASVAGLLPYHTSAPYMVTKHAVVALSEQLQFSLTQRESKLKTSVLCPGWVKTSILESERNRPPELQNEGADRPLSPVEEAAFKQMQAAVETGISPENVADQTFQAIRDEKFYILTHPEYIPLMRAAYDNRIEGLSPPLPQ
jgi:NADP-dependent 3-hydroxy acid dehydrogenase YdfG